MKFAEFENTRIEATPGATGFCPGCKAPLTAKCGDKNIWHWAHRGRKHCDFFREPETEWHRNWKDRFPAEWQEVSSRDEHGELHIADVKAPNGYVVEFQHSPIKIDEVKKRTKQHAPMIWVVDGLRRKTDKVQFEKDIEFCSVTEKPSDEISRLSPYTVRLVKEWCEIGAIVAFDFGEETVWLMSGRDHPYGVGFWYPKQELVECIRQTRQVPHVYNFEMHPRTRKILKWTHTIPFSILSSSPENEK